jgi:predicted RNA-binding Zn-ribbon protein involved in translation (DUF1610 family)
MFCNQCGTQLQPGSNTCPKCGKVATWPDDDSPKAGWSGMCARSGFYGLSLAPCF